MKGYASLLLALLLLPLRAVAWGPAGHEVIAAEAWRNLSPQLKADAIEVLKAHPDFARWQAAYHTNSSFDLYAYLFMRCSTWPDEIRGNGGKYDHADWHFVDYPLRPPGFEFAPGPKPDDDVLYGVAESGKALRDPQADPELRAASLSYLVHLIGDLHQPLHCASLYTADYPNGDRGGNDFFVKPAQKTNWDYSVKTGPALMAQKGVRLHGIWDGLLGSSANPRTHWNDAIQIGAKFPKSSLADLGNHATPKEWTLESRQLAIDKAYLRGELKGATNDAVTTALTADYMKEAKEVAEKQAALAGYRLAAEIEKCLKVTTQAPLLPVAAQTDTPAAPPKRITSSEATNYYNQDVVISGTVARANVRGNMAFIDLDKAYPNAPFTAVIFGEHLGEFEDVTNLAGKTVEISGTVTEYRRKPEIVLESPTQIKVVGAGN
jgi:hypothetical protein